MIAVNVPPAWPDTLLVWDTCPRCAGSGFEPYGLNDEACAGCDGEGMCEQEADEEPITEDWR